MVWWLSRKIAGPLEAFALQVDAIERLEINDAYPLQRSSFTEIDRLAQSVSRMSKALKAFAAFVPIDLEAFSALSENRPSHELLQQVSRYLGTAFDAVLVGSIGSIERMSYTLMDDGVNMTSRLEGLNKNFGTCICISKTVYRESGERLILRPLGDMEVKGRKSTIEVFELQGLIDLAS